MDQRSGDGRFSGRSQDVAVGVHRFPNVETLDAKIASVLKKIIQNSNFKKKVNLEEQKIQWDDRFLRGRQIAFMIHEHFRAAGAHEAVLDHSDQFRITLHGDDTLEGAS